ncbi:hypothetical protein Holit_01242 [Hollandina sp. SP2]
MKSRKLLKALRKPADPILSRAPAAGVMMAEPCTGMAHVPSFLYLAARPHLYRGLGSKAVKSPSEGRFDT